MERTLAPVGATLPEEGIGGPGASYQYPPPEGEPSEALEAPGWVPGE
jgi:hypothetical protein